MFGLHINIIDTFQALENYGAAIWRIQFENDCCYYYFYYRPTVQSVVAIKYLRSAMSMKILFFPGDINLNDQQQTTAVYLTFFFRMC